MGRNVCNEYEYDYYETEVLEKNFYKPFNNM